MSEKKLTKVAMVSLGCAKNQVDAEMMMARLAHAGYAFVEEPGVSDIVLLNTCGFITAAKEEAIEWLNELIELFIGQVHSQQLLHYRYRILLKLGPQLRIFLYLADDLLYFSLDIHLCSSCKNRRRPVCFFYPYYIGERTALQEKSSFPLFFPVLFCRKGSRFSVPKSEILSKKSLFSPTGLTKYLLHSKIKLVIHSKISWKERDIKIEIRYF